MEICDSARPRGDDLSTTKARTKYLDLLQQGYIVAISRPCNTFSRATWATRRGPRPIRSLAEPRGLARLTTKERDRNIFADFSFQVARVAFNSATFFVLEQPQPLLDFSLVPWLNSAISEKKNFLMSSVWKPCPASSDSSLFSLLSSATLASQAKLACHFPEHCPLWSSILWMSDAKA